jgi:DNA-binding CsgD family transcriptional regulator
MKDLEYDIESMFIDGETPLEIAVTLKIPLSMVKNTLKTFGVDTRDIEEEIYSPYLG